MKKKKNSDQRLAAFYALLQSTPNYMIITDKHNKVRFISQQMAAFAQIIPSELAIGRPLLDLFKAKNLKLMFADILDSEGFVERVIPIEIDGEERYFKAISDKLADEAEGVFIDITDITSTIKSKLDAEEANRSKTNFLATMSHEIRTPMNAIMGIAQIELQKETLENAAAIEKIYNSATGLLGIINDILDMSKIETGKLELNLAEYDVSRLINDTVKLNIARIDSKPIKFILELGENLPSRLFGDETRLKQILNNLMSNAIKYTEKGYTKLSVKHYSNADFTMLKFIVEDTGTGLKPEDKESLFKGYTRFNIEANRLQDGIGLGLNITKRLVEMMDGTITVESDFGKGSIFTVEVKQQNVECSPIDADVAEQLCNFTFTGERAAEKLQTKFEPMPYGSVLVVDDVEVNLYVASEVLSAYKLKIETVNSGFAALEKVESGNVYDIIFMDHMMPEMDGIETTKKIREFGYNGAVVALTANALVGNEEMFIKNGFDGFVPKPIDMQLLNNMLNKFVRNRYPEEAKKYKQETVLESAVISEHDPKLLKVFCNYTANAIETLKTTLENHDTKLFTITVHSLKAPLANIGEYDASVVAAELERASQSGDSAFIADNIEDFIQVLKNLVKKYYVETAVTPDNGEITEDIDLLREQLQIITAACEDYDDDTVYTALDLLREKQWSSATFEKLECIYDALFIHSDFDKAAEIAASLKEK